MPKYKLILTVQDSFGMTKELEAGIVEATEPELSDEEINRLAAVLDPVFATDEELHEKVIATREEVIEKLPEVIPEVIVEHEGVQQAIGQSIKTIKYDSFTD
jgi:hypothetical protein